LKRDVETYTEKARMMESVKNTIAAAREEVNAKLSQELKAKASLEAVVAQKERDIRSLAASLNVKSDNKTGGHELVGEMKKKVATLFSDLAASKASERNTTRNTTTGAKDVIEERFASTSNAKAFLEARLAQFERDVRSLAASMDVKSVDSKDGQVLVNELQEKIANTVSELATSKAALELATSNEAKAAAEIKVMASVKEEVERNAEARALQSISKDIDAKLAAEVKARASVEQAHREAVVKLSGELKAKTSLETKVVQMEGDINSLRLSLKHAKANAAKEATARAAAEQAAITLKAEVDRFSRDLKTSKVLLDEFQRNATKVAHDEDAAADLSLRAADAEKAALEKAHQEAVAKLSAEAKTRTSLEAELAQRDHDLNSLEAKLRQVEATASDETKKRIVAEDAISAFRAEVATNALDQSLHHSGDGKAVLNALQDKVATLAMELAASQAALEVQESSSAKELKALKSDMDKSIRTLQQERDAIEASQKEAEAKYAAIDVSSLEARLRDAELRVAREVEGRAAAEAMATEATTQAQSLKAEVASLRNSVARAEAKAKAEQDKRIRAEWHRR